MTPWIPVLLASMVNVLFDVAVAATAVSNLTEVLFAGTGLSKVIVKLLTPWIGKLPRTPCNVRNDWGGGGAGDVDEGKNLDKSVGFTWLVDSRFPTVTCWTYPPPNSVGIGVGWAASPTYVANPSSSPPEKTVRKLPLSLVSVRPEVSENVTSTLLLPDGESLVTCVGRSAVGNGRPYPSLLKK